MVLYVTKMVIFLEIYTGIKNGSHQCVSVADFTYDTPESSLGTITILINTKKW